MGSDHEWLDRIVARSDRYTQKKPEAHGSNASQAARDRGMLVAWLRIAGVIKEAPAKKRGAPREG